ncbi:MAG: GspH/FimT family pseudopilin [Deltaproteobacteria bacterium]|nr:GspH/FimT family pseudopilin [Deltaproteobacteria bacterium]MBW2081016.1 GspH/FimT family pseudopilin [Deltaproteobacteria bacterium]
MEIWRKTTMHDQYCKARCHRQAGFTMVELMIVIAVIAILSAIAVPNIINSLPNYRLKAAARDMYSNMQKARMQAVKENGNIVVIFDASINPGFYYFDTNNDNAYTPSEYKIDLSTYGSGVDYGTGSATSNWNGDNCTQATSITFNSRGTSNSKTVYIQNQNNDICYAITGRSSGSIKLRKYNGRLPFNKSNWN